MTDSQKQMRAMQSGRRQKWAASRLKHRAMQALSPRVFWSLGALDERRAFWATIEVLDVEHFDQRSRELAERLMPYVSNESVVLDPGCGIGRPEGYLAPSVWHGVGADVSPRMLTLARHRHEGISNISWRLTKRDSIQVHGREYL